MRVRERHPTGERDVVVPVDVVVDIDAGRIHRTRTVGSAQRWWSPMWRFVLMDLLAIGAASSLTGRGLEFAGLAVVAVVISIRLANLYRPVLVPTALAHSGRITMAVSAGSLVAAAVAGYSAASACVFAVVAAPLVCLGRAAAYADHRRARERRPQPALIVGAGREGQELASRLLDHPEYGIDPLGFVDSAADPIDPSLPVGLVGGLDSLRSLVHDHRVERIFLDTSAVSETDLLEVLDLASGLDVEVSVLPALARHLSASIEVDAVAGSTVLSYRPSRHVGVSWALKRVIDVVGAFLMLLASAPVWVLVAIAIKLDSRGPVLYKQTRVGRYGRPFTIYKFRSMETDADARKSLYLDLNEASGPYFKLRRDPRTTQVGRWIRRFSIDELPQVLNVLRGDMSLVGPRPALAAEVAEYPTWFRRRLSVRPGLSGLWQVSGRFLVPFAEATRLDVHYVDHWSLALDLQILARTPGVVVSGRGAR